MDVYDKSLVITSYKDFLQRKGLKDSSINVYLSVIKKFIKKDYDFENYSHYNQFLEDHTIKKRSFHYYDVLISFVNFYFTNEKKGVKNMILDAISMTKKQTKDPIRQTTILTDEQQMYVIRNLEDHKHKLIAWIQKDCGVRAGDVIRLKRDRIKFSSYKDGDKIYLIMEISFVKKGDRITRIPIFNAKLITYLKQWILSLDCNENYIFIDRDKVYKRHRDNEFKLHRKNYYDYWSDLKNTCEKIGIDPSQFSTHDWRRNFADRIWVDVLDRKDVEALRKALDHTDVNTTIRYLRQSGLQSQEVFKKSFDLNR